MVQRLKVALLIGAIGATVSSCGGQTNNSEKEQTSSTRSTESVSTAPPTADPPKTQAVIKDTQGGQPRLGNCHMGECSWSREFKRDTLRTDKRGSLIRVSLLGGSSTTENSKVSWESSPHDVFVFCSTSLPAVMLQTDTGWQVDTLDLVNGVPDVLNTSAAIYSEVCHSQEMIDASAAERLGYHASPDGSDDIVINRPEDIFDRVK